MTSSILNLLAHDLVLEDVITLFIKGFYEDDKTEFNALWTVVKRITVYMEGAWLKMGTSLVHLNHVKSDRHTRLRFFASHRV